MERQQRYSGHDGGRWTSLKNVASRISSMQNAAMEALKAKAWEVGYGGLRNPETQEAKEADMSPAQIPLGTSIPQLLYDKTYPGNSWCKINYQFNHEQQRDNQPEEETVYNFPKFKLRRGPNYTRNLSSTFEPELPMLDLISVELFYSDYKIKNIASRFDPDCILLEEKNPTDDLFVINFQVPCHEEECDKPSHSLVFVFSIPKHISDVIHYSPGRHISRPELRLLQKFWYGTKHDQARLKVSVQHEDKFKIFSTAPLQTVYRSMNNGRKYINVDVDIGNTTTAAFNMFMEYLNPSIRHRRTFHIGFIIEGQRDEELPEKLLAAGTFNFQTLYNVQHL